MDTGILSDEQYDVYTRRRDIAHMGIPPGSEEEDKALAAIDRARDRFDAHVRRERAIPAMSSGWQGRTWDT